MLIINQGKSFFTAVVFRSDTRSESVDRLINIVNSGFAKYIRLLEFQTATGAWLEPYIWPVHNGMGQLSDGPRTFVDLFNRMPNLESIGIQAVFPDSRVIESLQAERSVVWDLDRDTLPATVLRSILYAVCHSNIKLRDLTISGFVHRKYIAYGYPPRDQDLVPLYHNRERFMFLRTLELEYSHPPDGREPQLSFLGLLRHTRHLESLKLSLIDTWFGDRFTGSPDRRSDEIMRALGKNPVFSLESLELRGLTADSRVTFSQVLGAHAKTLRFLILDEVELRAPNTTLAFYSALADLDLQYYRTSNFRSRAGYVVACKVRDTNIEDEVLEWDSASMEKDETYKGWVLHSRECKRPEDWLVYDWRHGHNVKEEMTNSRVMVECGALD
jgi:hypothetical protein